MSIGGVLFDKDGTLLDFNGTWMPVYRTAALAVARGDKTLAAALLQAGGQDDALGTVASGSLLAVGNTHQIAAAWAESVPDHGYANLFDVINEIFLREGATGAAAVADMAGIIRRLKGHGLALGIATNDSQDGAVATLQAFDILGQFCFIAGYDSGFGTKPDPGMVLGFCKAAGLAPEEVLVVGDNPHDLEMGRRARAGLCVGVLTGNSSAKELGDLADHVVDSIAAIERLL